MQSSFCILLSGSALSSCKQFSYVVRLYAFSLKHCTSFPYFNIKPFGSFVRPPCFVSLTRLVSFLLWLLLTSDFTSIHRCIRSPHGHSTYLRQYNVRSLRVRSYAFYSCSLSIYVYVFCTVLGFCFFCNITHTYPPYMKFLFVGSNICRQLLSDSQSPTTPLLLTNDKYCNSRSGLTPYSIMTMPDTQKWAICNNGVFSFLGYSFKQIVTRATPATFGFAFFIFITAFGFAFLRYTFLSRFPLAYVQYDWVSTYGYGFNSNFIPCANGNSVV